MKIRSTYQSYQPICSDPGVADLRTQRRGNKARYLSDEDDDPDVIVTFPEASNPGQSFDQEEKGQLKKTLLTEFQKQQNEMIIRQLKCGLICFLIWAVLVVSFLIFVPPLLG